MSNDIVDLDRRTSAVSAYGATPGGTSSLTFVDLSPAVSVPANIGALGNAVVSIYANLSNTGLQATLMSFRISGASSVAASDSYAIGYTPGVANTGSRIGATFPVSALSSGMNTFTLQGRSTSNATTANFTDARLTVSPQSS